ncbi:hypothetical protein YPH_1571 [Yersinia pestis biovar Orientalis str. PEXU2]|nr:hypothetical protein YPH_1571 [Yersinia pestis biovar Orientalis str. PEXU2]EEO91763.1 hypothetical protein YPS_0708 [Yersinia pestis Pestoides A]
MSPISLEICCNRYIGSPLTQGFYFCLFTIYTQRY